MPIAALLIFAPTVTAAPAVAPAQPAIAAPAGRCDDTRPQWVETFDGKLQPRKLADLPTANAYAAMYRRVDGCEEPVVIRYRIGR